jgi:hypothetical protein
VFGSRSGRRVLLVSVVPIRLALSTAKYPLPRLLYPVKVPIAAVVCSVDGATEGPRIHSGGELGQGAGVLYGTRNLHQADLLGAPTRHVTKYLYCSLVLRLIKVRTVLRDERLAGLIAPWAPSSRSV